MALVDHDQVIETLGANRPDDALHGWPLAPLQPNERASIYTRSDERQFVEIGIRNGYAPWNPCNCTAYAIFWADFDSSGMEHPHWIANESPDGSNHSYEIQRDFTTQS